MPLHTRLVLASTGLLSLEASFAIAWTVLPFPKHCLSFVCERGFDSGGVDVFGAHVFTLPQTLLMMVGILAAAGLIARAVFPVLPRSSLALGVAALATVVAITLPSRVIGQPPSVPCSTPGANGPVFGTCMTGPYPTDARVLERVGLVSMAALAMAAGVAGDFRSRRTPSAISAESEPRPPE